MGRELLSQTVCRACMARHRTKTLNNGKLSKNTRRWDVGDDVKWSLGSVECSEEQGTTSTCSEPPWWCIYTMEHLVCREAGGEDA
jgi:hypothetical protein